MPCFRGFATYEGNLCGDNLRVVCTETVADLDRLKSLMSQDSF